MQISNRQMSVKSESEEYRSPLSPINPRCLAGFIFLQEIIFFYLDVTFRLNLAVLPPKVLEEINWRSAANWSRPQCSSWMSWSGRRRGSWRGRSWEWAWWSPSSWWCSSSALYHRQYWWRLTLQQRGFPGSPLFATSSAGWWGWPTPWSMFYLVSPIGMQQLQRWGALCLTQFRHWEKILFSCKKHPSIFGDI